MDFTLISKIAAHIIRNTFPWQKPRGVYTIEYDSFIGAYEIDRKYGRIINEYFYND
jgi:hypothetical protein